MRLRLVAKDIGNPRLLTGSKAPFRGRAPSENREQAKSSKQKNAGRGEP
jgi:hypothetical protein